MPAKSKRKSAAAPKPKIEREATANALIITCRSTLKTPEDVLKAAKVDERVWRVDRFKVNKWDMAAKVGGKGQKTLQTVELWQVTLYLKRLVPDVVVQAIDKLVAPLTRFRPRVPTKRATGQEDHLLEIALHDLHFGKRGVDGYNLAKAEMVYANAIDDILADAGHKKIEKIILPIGQDFFHFDNLAQTTTHGTQMDTSNSPQEVFLTGFKAVLQAIERCLQAAPQVKLIWVPGNHDTLSSWFLARMVAAYYHHVPERVEVVADLDRFRHYEAYGKVLLGFTHGNKEKHDQLPYTMSCEAREMWAETDEHYWHLGHFHVKRETKYKGSDTWGSCTVTVIPSLSGTDAWHYQNGYVSGTRCAEGYLYSRERGLVATFKANARDN